MGKTSSKYEIQVKTGSQMKAGTDADVFITLHDKEGFKTNETELDNILINDFEAGKTDNFVVKSEIELQNILKISLRRNSKGLFDDWYVETIFVRNLNSSDVYWFPIYRWIKEDFVYQICCNDTFLPQDDPHCVQREMEIKDKRCMYELTVNIDGFPSQIKKVPDDEDFIFSDFFNLVLRRANILARSAITYVTMDEFKCIDDIKRFYGGKILYEPECTQYWTEDAHFADLRLAGLNHSIIELITEIPEKLAVTEDMLMPLLEGNSLEKIIAEKRLFMTDLKIVEGIPMKSPDLKCCAPMALFYVNESKRLVPIAIQLFQKPAKTNPVFFPSDPFYTWLIAKMWYNNADGYVHETIWHFAYTHGIMEGFSIISQRNFSQSHPLLKLLSPHFEFLIAINNLALSYLIAPGGFCEQSMGTGQKGFLELVKRGTEQWRFDQHGILPENLKRRGVFNTDVLPGYHFRDDALSLYYVIEKYVTNYISLYYDTNEKLVCDWELQDWAKEVVIPQNRGGLGIQGFPGEGKIETKDQLITIMTCIIYTCTGAHAATNLPQYDQYGFPPNCPLQIHGDPPTTKVALTEEDILKSLPDKETTLQIMVVNKILSENNEKNLGNFEARFIFDPAALVVLEEFKYDLKQLSMEIKIRNVSRDRPYSYLDPEIVPNCIAI